MAEMRDAEIHHLIGGELCMDFANTLYGHTNAPVHEYLLDYRDLVLWSRHAGILTEKEAKHLLQESHHNPDQAEDVFRRAIALREATYRIFANLADRRSPKADDLALLHTTWLGALSHSRLSRVSNGFQVEWAGEHLLEYMLWPITDSSIKLLTSEEAKQIKQCSGCDWLFVDRSRSHRRRWCSMAVCGNRAKMRRRNTRHKHTGR
jgi:predicted RNA-binding Zn ribbon-like protein